MNFRVNKQPKFMLLCKVFSKVGSRANQGLTCIRKEWHREYRCIVPSQRQSRLSDYDCCCCRSFVGKERQTKITRERERESVCVGLVPQIVKWRLRSSCRANKSSSKLVWGAGLIGIQHVFTDRPMTYLRTYSLTISQFDHVYSQASNQR